MPPTPQTYKSAGVDRNSAEEIKRRITSIASKTHGPNVLGGIGGFGALFQLQSYKNPVLVSSTDGVGTKLKIAAAMNIYDGLGRDLVNACVNDVIVCGAKPLFFLDYLAMGQLSDDIAVSVVDGMARACEEIECALIGGELAELPGLYSGDDFDMAGFAVGAVEKDKILDGSNIAEGDLLIGIPSSGLHTNGYSLVRNVFKIDDDPSPLHEYYSELGQSLGKALVAPHRSYYRVLEPVFDLIKGMAHITGGGLIDNVPRVLPKGLSALFTTDAWQIPPIFSILQNEGNIESHEMYRVFNMGLGMVLICDSTQAQTVTTAVQGTEVVGRVIEEDGRGRVILE